jgi:threonine dehydratase
MSKSELDIKTETLAAEERIRPHVRETPVERSVWLSGAGGCNAYLKLENLQATGSFKIRGAANKLLSLSEAERQRGIVTASSGNHGTAVAHLLHKFGWPGTIFVPEDASGSKVEMLQQLGADLRFHSLDCLETERFAKLNAEQSGRLFVSPCDDPKIIGGQGTVALELERQVDGIDTVFVPVGGGGLIAGIAGYLKSQDAGIEIVGCQPEASPVMYESVKAGRIVELDLLPTLSDGTAGGIEKDAITLPICRDLVDRFVLVSEDEIKEAIRLVLLRHHTLVEGAAALSVASFLKTADRYAGKTVVLILSGAKISLETLRQVLA